LWLASADVHADPAAAVAPQPVGGCSPNQIAIPAGTFNMGDPSNCLNERPVHTVTLSPYCIDKTEVTVAAYRACVQAGACEPARTTVSWREYTAKETAWASRFCNWGKRNRDQHPINCVDWEQANVYCVWTGGRLPSEAEWEYAARGNQGRKFPWGSAFPNGSLLNGCDEGCVRMESKGWGMRFMVLYRNSDHWLTTAPVGRYPVAASPFGVLDMAGNVWEWVADHYAPYPSNAQDRPNGEQTESPRPDGALRAIRGGGWGDNDWDLFRGASRKGKAASDRDSDLGFRCARTAR
jgi:formylglycine-generating enzyme required for sulfatase activity